MGGRARDHQRQFPAGCLPRSAVDRGGIAYTYAYSDSYCNSDGNCDPDFNTCSHAHSNCTSEPYSHCYGYGYGYTDAYACADHPKRFRPQGTWSRYRGSVLERGDFKQRRYLPQRADPRDRA